MCDTIKAIIGGVGICVAFSILGYVGYILLLKGSL